MATGGVSGEGTSNRCSIGFAWSILQIQMLYFHIDEELKKVPKRTDPGYLDFCKKTIGELNDKLKVSEEEQNLRDAEETIVCL